MSMTMEEAGDKCLGQESCEGCPRMGDDCDGKEQEEWEADTTDHFLYRREKIDNWEEQLK